MHTCTLRGIQTNRDMRIHPDTQTHTHTHTSASRDEATSEPWNIFIHLCSHGNKWNHIPFTTLFSTQKCNHLLKTYSHAEKLCDEYFRGGSASGCRHYGPWPTSSFQAENSHILPHCGWCWGGRPSLGEPWLLALLYGYNSSTRTPQNYSWPAPFFPLFEPKTICIAVYNYI